MSSLAPNLPLNRSSSARNPYLTDSESTARSDFYSSAILLVWMIGTIFLGKDFSYLSIGPLFVTEMALGLLIFNNINRIRLSDMLVIVAVIAYVIAGTVSHGSFTFAGKDIIWLPYLMFLRFFPRNFPSMFTRVIVVCCFVKVFALLLVPVVEIFPVQKYRDGITILFCFLYLYLKRRGNLGIPTILFFIVVSVFIEFKTLMLVMLVAPVVMKFKQPWEKLVTPKISVIGMLVLLFSIKVDITRGVLLTSVDILNQLAQLLKLDVYLDSGTSSWRADIWSRAINNIYEDKQLLFGQLPGFNFMNDAYLGIKLNLGGGQGLGVVRTGHNILVQMMMKAGLVGVLIYIGYFFRNLPDKSRMSMFFVLSVLSLALTADVLEVPSRGPLFFCLFVIFIGIQNKELNQKPHEENTTVK